jgi:L-threonylcarbamoyladenylate synthase
VLLRPGVLTLAQLEAACGQPVLSPEELVSGARASGRHAGIHYAPNAKVGLMDAESIRALDLLGRDAPTSRCPLHHSVGTVLFAGCRTTRWRPLQQLFAVLRDFDAQLS